MGNNVPRHGTGNADRRPYQATRENPEEREEFYAYLWRRRGEYRSCTDTSIAYREQILGDNDGRTTACAIRGNPRGRARLMAFLRETCRERHSHQWRFFRH